VVLFGGKFAHSGTRRLTKGSGMNSPGIRRWFFIGSALSMGYAGLWWFYSLRGLGIGIHLENPIHASSAVVLIAAGAVAFRRGLREHLQHTIQRGFNYATWEAAVYGLAGAAAIILWFEAVPWQFSNGYLRIAVVLTLLLPSAAWMFNRALHDYSSASNATEGSSGLQRPPVLARP
jgi:hypothetical protein